MRLYFKLFFWMGLPFGFFMGLMASLGGRPGAGFLVGLSSGVFYGGFMSIFLGTLHRLRTRKLADGKIVEPVQIRTLDLETNFETTFDRALKALNEFGAKVESQHLSSGEIRARSGLTWNSWGEKLTMRLEKVSMTQTRVTITSSPRLPSTLIDFGKGFRNVEALSLLLRAPR